MLAVTAADGFVAERMSMRYSEGGDLTGKIIDRGREVRAGTAVVLEGFRMVDVRRADLPHGGVQFTKTLSGGRREVRLTERFKPAASSLRWEVDLWDDGPYWSTPIALRLTWPATARTRFWTGWGDPRGNVAGNKYHNEAIANAMVEETAMTGGDWTDPLEAVPLRRATFHYGAPHYT
jgi:hypothetical protein